MARVKQTPIEKRTKQLYANMKKRIEEKKDKNGRVIRHGQPIPFTYEQLLEWMQEKFERYDCSGCLIACRCKWCSEVIDINSAAIDHEIPLKRGGSADLINIDYICRQCNQYKGGLMPSEFNLLRRWLMNTFCDAARSDIEGRLKKAIKLAASVRWGIKKKAKNADTR